MMRLDAVGNRDEHLNTEGVNITWVAGWGGAVKLQTAAPCPQPATERHTLQPNVAEAVVLSFKQQLKQQMALPAGYSIARHSVHHVITYDVATCRRRLLTCADRFTRQRQAGTSKTSLSCFDRVCFLSFLRWVVEGFRVFCLRIF